LSDERKKRVLQLAGYVLWAMLAALLIAAVVIAVAQLLITFDAS